MQFFIKKGEIVNHYLIKTILFLSTHCIMLHASQPRTMQECKEIIDKADPELLKQAKEKLKNDQNFKQLVLHKCETIRQIGQPNPIAQTPRNSFSQGQAIVYVVTARSDTDTALPAQPVVLKS